jgi:hypothetical protein
MLHFSGTPYISQKSWSSIPLNRLQRKNTFKYRRIVAQYQLSFIFTTLLKNWIHYSLFESQNRNIAAPRTAEPSNSPADASQVSIFVQSPFRSFRVSFNRHRHRITNDRIEAFSIPRSEGQARKASQCVRVFADTPVPRITQPEQRFARLVPWSIDRLEQVNSRCTMEKNWAG